MEASALTEVEQTHPEIERKFLVPPLPTEIAVQVQIAPWKNIEQGYLPDKGPRLRRETMPDGSKRYIRTEKEKIKASNTYVKNETERLMTEEEFEREWPKTEGRRVQKTRYNMPLGEYTVELDVFQGGDLDGRMLAEVEFDSANEANGFVPPEWFGRDVTEEISNRKLAKGMPLPHQ